MSRTRLSKVTITPRGAWDAKAEYKRLDAVSNGGASWLAKRDNTGITPVEGDDWMMLTQKQIDDGAVELSTTWSSKNIIDRLCPEVTATGNPVVLEDVVEGYPMDVTASWDVQQEGEGEPHLAGYGQNQWKWGDLEGNSADNFGYPYIIEVDDFPDDFVNTPISIRCFDYQGRSTENAYETLHFYSVDRVQIEDASLLTKGATITLSEKPNYVYAYVGSGTGGGHFRKIMMVKGSNIPTEYDPYEANIRSFVGKKSVTIKTYSENLFKNVDESVSIWKNWSGTFNGFANGKWAGTPIPIERLGKTGDVFTYQMRAILTGANGGASITPAIWYTTSTDDTLSYYYDSGATKAVTGEDKVVSETLVITSDMVSVYLGITVKFENQTTGRVKEAMLSRGRGIKEYVPYKETEVTIELPETVYSGEVDNNGECTSTRVIIPIAQCNQRNGDNSAKVNWFSIYCSTADAYRTSVPHLSNMFPSISWVGTNVNYSSPKAWYAGVSFGILVPKSVLGLADDYVAASDSEIISAIREWLNSLEVTPVFEALLQKPKLLVTEPCTILSANTATTDADSLTVTARADPIKTITNLTNRVAALEAAATNIEEV